MAESAFNIGDIQGQIKGLTDQIGTFKLKEYAVSANSTKTITCENISRLIVITVGSNSARSSMTIVNVSSLGSFAIVKVLEGANINISGASNILSIENTSSIGTNAFIIVLSGDVT